MQDITYKYFYILTVLFHFNTVIIDKYLDFMYIAHVIYDKM